MAPSLPLMRIPFKGTRSTVPVTQVRHPIPILIKYIVTLNKQDNRCASIATTVIRPFAARARTSNIRNTGRLVWRMPLPGHVMYSSRSSNCPKLRYFFLVFSVSCCFFFYYYFGRKFRSGSFFRYFLKKKKKFKKKLTADKWLVQGGAVRDEPIGNRRAGAGREAS